MRRASELLDAVRGAMSGATMEPGTELALAQEVVRACADTRERLVRAIDLMRQGLRGEAMVIVDVRPTLTEVAAALADPAISRWRKRCAERGLPVPQPIDPDLVHELSEGVAEAEDPRVDQLMRRLRYQNLAHAPAHERLRTMWALRRVDPASVRESDISLFEQAALKELMDRLRTAVAAKDFAAAEHVREELRRPDWADRDIAARRATAESECDALSAATAARRGSDTLDELEACMMRGDAAAARDALDRYEAIAMEVEVLGGSISPAMRSRAEPLAQWVREREQALDSDAQARDLVSTLERLALQPSASPDELERAMLACDTGGVAVSDSLRESVERRMLAERRRRTRNRAAIAAVAIAAGLAAAGGAVWFGLRHQRQAQLDSVVAAADAALGRGDLDGATRALADAKAAGVGEGLGDAIEKAQSRIDAARAEIAAKDKSFEEALAAAGDPRLETATAEAGERAARAARTKEQAAQAEEWSVAFEAARARRQAAVDDALMAQVNRLAGELQPVEAGTLGAGADDELRRIQTELERLSRSSRPSAQVQVAMRRVEERIRSAREVMDRERAVKASAESEAMALQALVDRVSESYATALREFLRDHPESGRSPDFRTALAREQAWSDVLSIPDIAGRLPRSLDPGDAAVRTGAAQALDAAIAACAQPSPILAGLRAARELAVPQDSWAQFLEDYVTENPLAQLRMVELSDGTRHYYDPAAKAPIEGAGGTRVYTIMVSVDGKTQPIAIEKARIARDGPSPQAEAAVEMRAMVRGARASRSVATLLAAMERIRSDARVDPVLRAMLLERLMEEGAPAAPHLAKPMQDAVVAIRRLNLAGIDWIAPGDPASRPESKEAIEVLKRAVDIPAWQKRHERRLSDVRRWLSSRVSPAGILERPAAGSPRALVPGKAKLKPGERIYAVSDAPGGSLQLVEVGSVADGGTVTLSSVPETLPGGTLLFAGKVEQMPAPSGP